MKDKSNIAPIGLVTLHLISGAGLAADGLSLMQDPWHDHEYESFQLTSTATDSGAVTPIQNTYLGGAYLLPEYRQVPITITDTGTATGGWY